MYDYSLKIGQYEYVSRNIGYNNTKVTNSLFMINTYTIVRLEAVSNSEGSVYLIQVHIDFLLYPEGW